LVLAGMAEQRVVLEEPTIARAGNSVICAVGVDQIAPENGKR
jgi:hypothetical protein